MSYKRAKQHVRVAGMLIIIGLLVEAFTLAWTSPVTFLVFMTVGGLFLVAGLGYVLILLLIPRYLNPRDLNGESKSSS